MRKLATVTMTIALLVASAVPAFAGGPPPRDDDGNRVRVTVYVESQGFFFDSIVGPDLPMKGKFQKLYMGDHGLTTEFGPGDPGYRGGRWWVDLNGNGEMDSEDHFFSCPLLGHGSATPPPSA